MPAPLLTPERITYLSQQVAQYISSQRVAYSNTGAPMARDYRSLLTSFFQADLLARTRVALVEQPVKNPPFYPALRQMGFDNLPDFSTMAAITFVDVIICHVQVTSGLLFHEMVHVVQYSKLGLGEFSRHYVEGFLCGGSYECIPLEMNAYQLEERFKANPSNPFSVEAEVQQWIDAGKF